jgi:hypothetical protein
MNLKVLAICRAVLLPVLFSGCSGSSEPPTITVSRQCNVDSVSLEPSDSKRESGVTLTVSGWIWSDAAVDSASRPFIQILDDKGRVLAARSARQNDRQDVARHYGAPHLVNSGIQATIDFVPSGAAAVQIGRAHLGSFTICSSTKPLPRT